MKKLTSALVACACMTAVLAGCSESAVSESSIKEKRVSTNPINQELLGTWMNGPNGYTFQDNRKVSLVLDFTEEMCFNSDGSLHTIAAEVPPEEISFDGTTLSAAHLYEGDEEPMELFTLQRRNGSDSSDYDGEYDVVSGGVIDSICSLLGSSPENTAIAADINDGAFTFTVEDYCDYETSDDRLDLFSEFWSNVEGVSYSFEINGSELSLTEVSDYATSPIIYTRVD